MCVCVERGVGMVVVVVARVECMRAYVQNGMSCVCCMYRESAYACMYGRGVGGGIVVSVMYMSCTCMWKGGGGGVRCE